MHNKSMGRRSLLVGILAVSMASSCSEGIPPDKKEYVGEWVGIGMKLLITPDGGFVYHRVGGGGSRKISSPISEFVGDNFVVGFWFLKTTFEVSKPPYNAGGTWKMVVDGVELSRRPPGEFSEDSDL